jgi:ankyrin repeat protein
MLIQQGNYMEHPLGESLRQVAISGTLQQIQDLCEAYGTKAICADENLQELTTLHQAAAAGNLDVVRFLISDEVKADPCAARINNFTPLHSAAMYGHAEICEELLAVGANVNIQTEPQGYTPLHSAAFAGHLQAIKVLLAHGANLDLRNYRNERPVDTAQRQNQSEVVTFLTVVMNDGGSFMGV